MPDPVQARRAGVLLHLSSLPSGRIDDDAMRWVDFMAAAGLSVWQVLPLVIPDGHGSPYQSRSAFAMDPRLLPLDDAPVNASEFETFCAEQAYWLDDFTLFQVFKAHFDERSWVDWPAPCRQRDPDVLAAARATHARAIATLREEQFRLDRAWRRLRRHAGDNGIELFGDIPIFVAHDSADTWARPEEFLLDAQGRPTHVTGVPPDYFSATGQRWGNPHYRWDRMEAENFSWWMARMQRQFELFDLVRIDHFRGLVAVWMIDADCETAIEGHWRETPGDGLLATLRQRFPDLHIVAEDLGVITEEVRALRRKYGLPGMAVLQFAFDHFADNPHKPVNITTDTIVYTGTHDNDTCVGWFEGLQPDEREFVFQVLGVAPRGDIADLMIETAMHSEACLAMAPLQDFLGLDSGARMNTPGVTGGNWRWRFDWAMLPPGLEERIRVLSQASGRCDAR